MVSVVLVNDFRYKNMLIVWLSFLYFFLIFKDPWVRQWFIVSDYFIPYTVRSICLLISSPSSQIFPFSSYLPISHPFFSYTLTLHVFKHPRKSQHPGENLRSRGASGASPTPTRRFPLTEDPARPSGWFGGSQDQAPWPTALKSFYRDLGMFFFPIITFTPTVKKKCEGTSPTVKEGVGFGFTCHKWPHRRFDSSRDKPEKPCEGLWSASGSLVWVFHCATKWGIICYFIPRRKHK